MDAFKTTEKDAIKMRLRYMARDWKNKEYMYRKMEEKKLMSCEIWNSITKLIEDIENGKVGFDERF